MQGHGIEGGAIGQTIAEMNVTGNYDDLLGRLVAVGNDPVPGYACRTPTLVFDDVEFSGKQAPEPSRGGHDPHGRARCAGRGHPLA